MIVCSLTNLQDSTDTLLFQVTPESLPGEYDLSERKIDPLDAASVSLPKNAQPTVFTLDCWLPGGTYDYGMAYARPEGWRPPADIEFQIRQWQRNGTYLVYLATETSFAATVYVKNWKPTWGELDRIAFSLTLIEGGSLLVPASSTASATSTSGSSAQPAPSDQSPQPDPATASVYTTKDGDTLWNVASLELGDATRWPEIYDANKASDSNPNGLTNPDVLPVSYRLTIPSGDPKVSH